MADSDFMYGTTLSLESMKVIAESIGISNLPDDAAKELSDDVSYRLKIILQDAAKFMNHANRQKLCLSDVDHSIAMKNMEPQYGFIQSDNLPFRFASGGGRELHFVEEKELDLSEILSAPPPKIPLDVSVRAHWLCVDGVQPTIPENPPPLSREAQRLESVDPLTKLTKTTDKDSVGKPLSSKATRLRATESVVVKQLATHELSVEQQLYYKEITEACVGSDEAKRAEALQSLSMDPGLHEMLPRMCTFISEGVKVNVVQNNLALLIYLMRMVKALLDNQALYLEKYLHELIPSVSTCIVSRQLCSRPEVDNHWALRDFASRLMAQICKTFNTATNNVQTRVTRLFSRALEGNEGEKPPLASLYGAIMGLSELGSEVVKVLILPMVRSLADRIESAMEASSGVGIGADRVAASNIRNQLVKVLAPIIKQNRPPPDSIDEYKRDYGVLGTPLIAAVTKSRAMLSVIGTPSSAPGPPGTPTAVSVVPFTTPLVPHSHQMSHPASQIHHNPMQISKLAVEVAPKITHAPGGRTAVVIGSSGSSSGTMASASHGPGLPSLSANNSPSIPAHAPQRFVVVTQKQQMAANNAAQPKAMTPVITQQLSSTLQPKSFTPVIGQAPGPGQIKQVLSSAHLSNQIPASPGPMKQVLPSAATSQVPISVVPKPIFVVSGGSGNHSAPPPGSVSHVPLGPPPELDDLSHLA